MPFDPNTAWLGVGTKVGGMLIGAGVVHSRGIIVRSTNPTLPFDCSPTSMRVGLGLGFSGGLVIFMVFKCNNLQNIHNTRSSDWRVTISLGGRWTEIARVLRRSESFAHRASLGWRARALASQGSEVRELLHQAYTLYDVRTTGNSANKVITFETPVGAGAEVAVNVSEGIIRIG